MKSNKPKTFNSFLEALMYLNRAGGNNAGFIEFHLDYKGKNSKETYTVHLREDYDDEKWVEIVQKNQKKAFNFELDDKSLFDSELNESLMEGLTDIAKEFLQYLKKLYNKLQGYKRTAIKTLIKWYESLLNFEFFNPSLTKEEVSYLLDLFNSSDIKEKAEEDANLNQIFNDLKGLSLETS